MAETIALDGELGVELVDYGDSSHLLDAAIIAQCRESLKWRGGLLVRGAHLDDDHQVAFGRALRGVGGVNGGRELTTTSMDKTVNIMAEYLKGAFNRHLDDTTSDVPCGITMLTGRRLSAQGGSTQFANTYATYQNSTGDQRRRFEGLPVVHSFEAAQPRVNPDPTDEQIAGWRTARLHDSAMAWRRRDRRRSLVIGATANHVVGSSADESCELLDGLLAWATRPRFCHTHDGAVGDAVLWDNTAVLHRALPYDPNSDRMLLRTHVRGQEEWA